MLFRIYKNHLCVFLWGNFCQLQHELSLAMSHRRHLSPTRVENKVELQGGWRFGATRRCFFSYPMCSQSFTKQLLKSLNPATAAAAAIMNLSRPSRMNFITENLKLMLNGIITDLSK